MIDTRTHGFLVNQMRPVADAIDVVTTWRLRLNQRRKLSHLDEHLLADIGLSRQQVDEEIDKPFWRP